MEGRRGHHETAAEPMNEKRFCRSGRKECAGERRPAVCCMLYVLIVYSLTLCDNT